MEEFASTFSFKAPEPLLTGWRLTYNLKGILHDKTKFLFVFHHPTQILYAR